MDTRQLQAFCEVVERRSFSQAAERLGVTQPAVSLQIRSLEKRLGTQLLDRSGRRVEPTEAGLKLYRSAQRLLQLEEEILAELAEEATGELDGTFAIGSSTGPGGVVGAAPRHRGVKYEPFLRDTVILACPPGHRFGGQTIGIDELKTEQLILMQEGAGVRQMIED